MTKHDCGQHRLEWRKCCRHLLIAFLILCLVVGTIVLIVFLVLRPTKPSFALHDASILGLDLSPRANLLSSTLQVTLFSRNPNARVGVYYDHLAVHAAYKEQQITVSTLLPPSYQGTKDASVWSPFLYGESIPVAPYVAQSLFSGVLLLHVKIEGRVRWKVGTWRSGGYRLHVDCPAIFRYGGPRGSVGGHGLFSPAITFQRISQCHVDV